MKTEAQMLDVAIDIANSSSAAYVGFFCRDTRDNIVRRLLNTPSTASFLSHSSKYVAGGGGVIKLFTTKPETLDAFRSTQFTHVFYKQEDFDVSWLNYLRHRILSANYDGSYPMGLYNQYYREICSAY